MLRVTLLVALLTCAGCVPLQITRFENPITDESGVRVDPALVGRWIDEEQQDETEVWEITANGTLRIISKSNDAGATSHDDRDYEIVTARLGSLTVLSLKGGSEDDDSWYYQRYWFPETGVLSFAPGDTRFWRDSVRNKMVAGTIERNGDVETDTVVTASGAELRAFVSGYGSVIFAEPTVDSPRLRRIPEGS